MSKSEASAMCHLSRAYQPMTSVTLCPSSESSNPTRGIEEWTVTSPLTNYFISLPFTMSSIMGTVKHAFDNTLPTAKVSDLATDTVSFTPSSGLTTDHGVKVSDTDNWYAFSSAFAYTYL